MTSKAGLCAPKAAWSASALSTACTSAIARWCATRSRVRATLGLPAVALSFEPLPREFFAKAAPPPRLTLPRAKFEGLRELGVDRVGLLRFDAALAAMSAEDFVA